MIWELSDVKMATLVERIRDLSARIKSLAGSQVSDDEARRFRVRAEELSDLSMDMSVPAGRLEGFSANQIHVDIPDSRARSLKRTIDEIAGKYDSDPSSILVPDANWRHSTKNRLTTLTKEVSRELSIAWRNYVSGIKPTIDQGLIIVLRSSPAYADHARGVQELGWALDQLAERLPGTQEEIDRPAELVTALLLAIQNLPADIPEPVRELFWAINRRTATAEHLTDEALGWLREKNMLDEIQVLWRSD